MVEAELIIGLSNHGLDQVTGKVSLTLSVSAHVHL
jgi:hypothetical protein